MLNVVNSVIRQQGCNSLRLLHKGIHGFLESPGDWSYWSMSLHVLTTYDVRRWKCASYL